MSFVPEDSWPVFFESLLPLLDRESGAVPSLQNAGSTGSNTADIPLSFVVLWQQRPCPEIPVNFLKKGLEQGKSKSDYFPRKMVYSNANLPMPQTEGAHNNASQASYLFLHPNFLPSVSFAFLFLLALQDHNFNVRLTFAFFLYDLSIFSYITTIFNYIFDIEHLSRVICISASQPGWKYPVQISTRCPDLGFPVCPEN